MRRQRSTRFSAASARCFSVRRAMTGTIVVTFSSVHFSIAHSMRSNLKTASSKVIGTTAFARNFFAESELHAVIGDAGDGGAPNLIAARYLELLAHARAQSSRQMRGVLPGEGGAIGGELVGNPAAAGHRVKSSRAVAMAMEA